MSEEPARITVSRDALRADLAEMELRLRVYFDEQLRHKADSGEFAKLALRVDQMDRGEFTDVHRRALVDLIEAQSQEREDRSWTFKQRVGGFITAVTAVGTLILSAVALRGGL